MFYVDSQRTTTRRDSSLVIDRKVSGGDVLDSEFYSSRPSSNTRTMMEPGDGSDRPRGAARKELITTMFDSMLDHIVQSWEIIQDVVVNKHDDNLDDNIPDTARGKNKGKKALPKSSRNAANASATKSRRSKTFEDWSQNGLGPCPSTTLTTLFPDERAVIKFENGNMYEGGISMKLMHGNGRFQWADGTVYLGNFVENRITGRGVIYWKDDSWYEGEFADNLRHGSGNYVNSRTQRAYIGQWHLGTKHGEGRIYFDGTPNNFYDGEWMHNVRHGYGIREYCIFSGYRGDWKYNVRDGSGYMIWPNQDFYRGGWKNGIMSDYGVYIWNNPANHTMTLPNLNIYRGQWLRGKRNGFGLIRFGLIHGSFFKGEFLDNKKNGAGKLVTNSGQIILEKNLFIEDVLNYDLKDISYSECPNDDVSNLFEFKLCDIYIGLTEHIGNAVKNLDKEEEVRKAILDKYIERNKLIFRSKHHEIRGSESNFDLLLHKTSKDFIVFEREALRKIIHRYEKELKEIYFQYATACSTKPVTFTPVLIRLYLWQLYYDCNVLDYGVTLVEIDEVFFKNKRWLARTPHNPYEQINFWQFIHGLISVAYLLFGKSKMPARKPETLVAEAFEMFMDKEVLPGAGAFRGNLVMYGGFIPLRSIYEVYCRIGMPHTILQFMRATRHSPCCTSEIQPEMLNAADDQLPFGQNAYIIGDEMVFINDEPSPVPRDRESDEKHGAELLLYNLGNLPAKTIFEIFYQLFPTVYSGKKLHTLDIQLTFFEFFEVLIRCVHESIRLSEESTRWDQKKDSTVSTSFVKPFI